MTTVTVRQCKIDRTAVAAPARARVPFTSVFTKSTRKSLLVTAQALKQDTDAAADIRFTLPMALAAGAIYTTPMAAWAEDVSAAVEPVKQPLEQEVNAATEAAANAAPGWVGYAVVLSPIIFYAIFNVYRSQVNPRIKFSDFLFIVAGIAVVANLVSIVAFKVRLF